ncbi:MAG: MFS transporter [Hyphomicrobiales bacterium]|nr:MFS transporter [Hyphomicrobiales bacterium]
MLDFYRHNARWLCGGFLLTCFSGFGQTFYISIWGSEIRGEFGLSHGDFGLVYMLATLASALVLPFVGRLVDVVSVSVSSLIVISMLSLAAVTMSYASSLPMLIAAIFMLRLFGQGMMTHTSITAMGRWYANNRGKAVSFATIGHQSSEALAPGIFVALAAIYGWRESWLIAAACLMLFALPVIFLLMRVERTPRSQLKEANQANEVGRQWTRNEMLADPCFWLTGVGVFAPSFIGTSIFFHQDYLIEVNNWAPSLYYNSFALMASTTVAVSLATGFAVDRWSAVQLLPLFMLPLGLACFVLGAFSAPMTIVAFMILLGFSYGMTSTLFGAIWPEVYGTKHLGSLRAVTMSLMVFMSAAGPGLTGWLIDVGIPFAEQLIYMGVFCLATIVLMSIASRLYQRRLLASSTV